MATITSPTTGTHNQNGLSSSVLTLNNGVFPLNIHTRWQFNLVGTESGANTGSNLQLQAIADDGKTIISTQTWTRANGQTSGSTQTLTAAGSTQGGATAITSSKVIVTVATTVSTKGVRLPVAATGLEVEVGNAATLGFKVYPATNGKIGAASTNAADTTLAVNKVNRYVAVNTTLWIVQRGA
jgi:hypothetical protein